jgi:HPt (histidine-containing phosphotransfer) domain-containing protein
MNELDAALRWLIPDVTEMRQAGERAALDGASDSVERPPSDVIDETALAYLRGLQSSGHSDVVAKCVVAFTRTATRRLAALRTALEEENLRALEQEAHALKGEASTVGASQVEALSAALLRSLSEAGSARFAELLDALDSAFDRARAALAPAVSS